MMIRRVLASAAASALIVGAIFVPTFAAGPTCAVPGDYPTIQTAVSDPGCTTVNVAPGTYTENVTIGHALTLQGAQAGVDARTARGSESIINGGAGPNITIVADSVTVDGFTLNGPSDSGTAALVMMGGNTGETIQNNVINNPGRAASFITRNAVFRQNAVNDTSTASDGFQGNSSPSQNVTFANNQFGGANSAIYNADITLIEGNSNIVVSGNSSASDGTLVALFKTNGAWVTGNTIVGASDSSAIYIGGGDSNITVSGNNVRSAASAVKVANAYGVGPNSAITVTNNTLNNNGYGVNVGIGAIGAAETVQVHQNSLAGNSTFGVNNSSSGGVAGTCNWWGAANGPGPVAAGSGDKVSTGVTFSPWLISSNLTGGCIGGNVATSKDQCKNDGWQDRVDDQNRPFKNQGQCVSFVQANGHAGK